MKKGVAFFGVCLLFSLLLCVSVLAVCSPASEVDGGINYFVKGIVTDGRIKYADNCSDSLSLVEYSCSNGVPKKWNVVCQEGCYNGACKKEKTALALELRFDDPKHLGTDYSGKSNKVSVSRTAYSPAGKSGGAINFNGNSSYMTIGDSANLRVNRSSTISIWVKPKGLSSRDNGVLFDKIALVKGNYTGYGLDIGFEGISFKFSTNSLGESAQLLEIRSSDSIFLDRWNQVVVVINIGRIDLYLNGVLQNTVEFSGKMQNSDKLKMKIAKGYNVSSRYYNGLVDEFKIYNRTLNEDEIKQDYAKFQNCRDISSGTCSSDRKYCDEGVLISSKDTCSFCPCAEGYRCDTSETCVIDIFGIHMSTASIKKNYFVGDFILLTDPPETEKIQIEDSTSQEVGDLQGTQTIFGEDQKQIIGYFVELKENSLVTIKNSLEDEINQVKEQSDEAKQEAVNLGPSDKIKKIRVADQLNAGAISKEGQVRAKINSQKNKISSEHKKFIDNVKNKKYERNILKRILGGVISDSQFQVLGDYSSILNGVTLNISAEDAEKLKNLPEVKDVYPLYMTYSQLDKSVPLINADDVWKMNDSQNRNITGKGVRVAVIDSGIDFSNPDFGGCTQEQFLSRNCPKIAGGWDYCADNILCNSQDNFPEDTDGHGTHVAGIIAANNALKGVAPDSILYIYKVANSQGEGSPQLMLNALQDIADPNGDGDFSDRTADIVSISRGMDCGKIYDRSCGPDDVISRFIDILVQEGIVVVVSAGNSGPDPYTILSPGTARNAITVGSVYKQDYPGIVDSARVVPVTDAVVLSSSRGPVITSVFNEVVNKPDVVAPGAIICSARYGTSTSGWSQYQSCRDSQHIAIGGTSMAAPMVSGVAALIKQAHPELTALEIKELIKNNAKYLTGFKTSDQGAGRVDALASISIIKSKMTSVLPYSVSGNLKMFLQKYSGSKWVSYNSSSIPVISILQTIDSGETISLDKIWNSYNVVADKVGTYRVNVSFESGGQKIDSVSSEFYVR